tara:strand:- start:299 stop:571 length:273 start_codon:yes stop_codon:yes gene_type:complete
MIDIDLDHDAFHGNDGIESARILRKLADQLEINSQILRLHARYSLLCTTATATTEVPEGRSCQILAYLYDSNGNYVGTCEVQADKKELLR